MAEAAQLDAFLAAMTQYSPTVPDELVEFYLQQTGFVTNDVRITRLISLVAHKLLLDVTHDAMQYQRIRSQATSSTVTGTSLTAVQSSDGNDNRAVLTMEDLAASLKEFGVNICRPEYVSDVAEEPTN
ncbi:unnamed protein product [Peronospora destructor]|uniref:Transcription initiation factor TFIID subunit 10 n=1 Tax=Peronospora destructor TaxID=86335 RepID=A0AAV0U0W8_9STRA|nr:unnamed protein product [Peronospora destructor]